MTQHLKALTALGAITLSNRTLRVLAFVASQPDGRATYQLVMDKLSLSAVSVHRASDHLLTRKLLRHDTPKANGEGVKRLMVFQITAAGRKYDAKIARIFAADA